MWPSSPWKPVGFRLSPTVFAARLAAVVLVVNLLVATLVATALRASHRQDQQRAEVSSRNLAVELQQTIDGTLGRVDLALLAVADEVLRQRAQGGIDGALLDAFIARQHARLPDLDSLRVIDAQGILRFGIGQSPENNFNTAGRDYFIRARDDPAAGLVISRPLKGFITGKWMVVFARPIILPDGSFGGVVNASLTIDHFRRMFSRLDIGPHGVVNLRSLDMTSIARTPELGANDDSVGQSAVSARLSEMLRINPDGGTYTARAGLDHVERTFTYRQIGRYPLYIFAGLAIDDYLAQWRGEAAKLCALVLAFALVTSLSAWMICRVWSHRERALRETQLSSARLRAILQSSPLGLAIVSPDRSIQLANTALSDLFALEGDAILGSSTSVYYESQAQFEQLGSRAYPPILAGETFRDEILMHRSDGKEFWCRLNGRLVDTSQPELGYIWILEDISERRRAEREIEELSRFNAKVIAESVLGIAVYKATGECVLVNQALARISGGTIDQLKAQNFRDLDGWERDGLRQAAELALASGDNQHVSRHFFTSFSHEFWGEVDLSVFAIEGERHLLVSVRDITELREREAEFRTTMEATTVGIFNVSELKFRYVNPALARMLGYTAAEMVDGMGPPDIVVPEERDEVRDKTIRRAQGEPGHPYRLHFLRKDGSVFDGLVWSNRTFFRGKPFTVGSVVDISDSVRAEAELRRISEQLATSNSELEQFAYVASHDLREPLRMISSYVTLLERRLDAKLDDEAHEFFGYVRDGAQRMNRLILDLLEYSRIGRGGQPMEPIDLGSVMEEVALNLSAALDEAQGRLDIAPALPTIVGDRSEVVRLLQNLVGNAVKYRADDRPPEIAVTAEHQEGEWVLTIRDNGIGIAQADHERIFGVFQRLHGRDKYEGTGIGLAICKRIVERHKGRIWLESEPGQGTAFHISLPAVVGGKMEMAEAPASLV